MPDWKDNLPPEVRAAILRNQARREVMEAINFDGMSTDSVSDDGRKLLGQMEIIDLKIVAETIGKLR